MILRIKTIKKKSSDSLILYTTFVDDGVKNDHKFNTKPDAISNSAQWSSEAFDEVLTNYNETTERPQFLKERKNGK